MMQQSEAASQLTDAPATMQQSEAASQQTDVPTTMQQEARVSAPSAATDSPQPTGTIGTIGTVSGSHSSIIVGSSGVTINTNTYNLPLEGPGVPAPRPHNSQRPEQEQRQRAPGYQDVGNKTRDILISWYKHGYVQLNPKVHDDQRPIVGIYTRVQIRTKKGTAEKQFTDEIAYSTEYETIFKHLNDFDRLILFGKGGVGKSTIFDMIAYDWADETSEILNRFKLVFLLKMCALVQESDLVDSTFDQLLGGDSGIAKDELDEFILANPTKVLILLDGFDEMMTKKLDAASFGSVLKALNRTRYRNCVICVSSRPSHLKTLMSKTLVQNPCTHVEVLGFNDEDVGAYVLKFYDEDRDSGKELIQTITESNTLSDFAANPMLLLLICLLWGEKKQLPETTSRLFTKAVHYMFTRKDEDKKNPSDAEKRKANVSEMLNAIGQTGLRGLMSANQNFSFQEDDFEPKALSAALKAGILTQQRVIQNHESHNNVQFMHKTMQEYCAGKYLQSVHMSNKGFVKRKVNQVVPIGKFQKNLRQLCRTIEGVYSNEFLLRFCCGDSEKCMTDIVNLLDCNFSKDENTEPRYQSHVIQAISRNCFLESQSAKVPQCLTSDSNMPPYIDVHGNNDFRSLIYLLKIICRSDSRMAQLARVETIEVNCVYSVRDLAFALRYMENVSHLKLRECPLEMADLENTLSAICSQHLTSLSMKGCHTLGGRAAEWAPHLKHLTSLNKLKISFCRLQKIEIKHIASAVREMPRLTDLNLSGNKTLGKSAELWAKELPKMKHLNRLFLLSCLLTPTDVEHIVSAADNMPRLTHLNFMCNKNSVTKLAGLWAKRLPRVYLRF